MVLTINSSAASQIFLGNGATNPFSCSIIAAPANSTLAQASSYIQLTYIDASGNQTILSPTTYTLSFNANYQGFTILHPTSGSPIANKTSLRADRIIPLTQPDAIANQGAYAPAVTEGALDNLELQIQQVSARTGQFRGTWATGVDYNFGDVVVDGANGTGTGNYYMCAIANTSGVWATDLANGDWVIAINVQGLSVIAGGSNTQVQYNNAGVLGGITGATTNGTFLTLTTPVLGVATVTSINKLSITTPATGSTLTIADGKTLTASNTLTFVGTDSSTITFASGGTVIYSGGSPNFAALGINTASLAGYGIRIAPTLTGATTSYGVRSQPTFASDVTVAGYGYYSSPTTAASAFTLSNLYYFRVAGATFGAGSTVSDQRGFYVDNAMTGATVNYGFYSDLAVSGTTRYNMYMNGTAPNYLAGQSGFGMTPSQSAWIQIAAASSTVASMFLTVGGPPTSPVDGMLWLESNTTTGLKIRLNGATHAVTIT